MYGLGGGCHASFCLLCNVEGTRKDCMAQGKDKAAKSMGKEGGAAISTKDFEVFTCQSDVLCVFFLRWGGNIIGRL